MYPNLLGQKAFHKLTEDDKARVYCILRVCKYLYSCRPMLEHRAAFLLSKQIAEYIFERD